MTRVEELNVAAYLLPTPPGEYEVTLERVGQKRGPDKWAIRCHRTCFSKSGEWEYEPMPSSRDDAFLARCRFDTPEDALATYQAFTAKDGAK